MKAGLDWEIVDRTSDNYRSEWEVWIPDTGVGFCVGSGKTRDAAIEDAIENVRVFLSEFKALSETKNASYE